MRVVVKWAAPLLSGRELQSLIWRIVGVAASAVTGMVALRAFLTQYPLGAAGMIAMLGWLAFLPLFQLGYGRPVYSLLRAAQDRKEAGLVDLRVALKAFGWMAGICALCFSVIGTWLVVRHGHDVPLYEIAVFGLGMALSVSGTFQRDLAYAMSQEHSYERAECYRRLAMLLSYVFLAQGAPMWVCGVGVAMVGVWTQRKVALAVLAAAQVTTARVLEGRVLHGDARRYLAFSANELLIYNLPLLYFSLAGGQSELVFIGVWTRFFQLAVLPMRMLVDARLNRQVSFFFRGERECVRRELRLSFWIAAVSVAVMVAVAIAARPRLLQWLGASALADAPWFLSSLAIWSAGNVIQHVYGSFALSYGGGFGFALKASLMTTLLTGSAFLLLQLRGLDIGLLMLVTGGLYLLVSLAYWANVRFHVLGKEAGVL